METRFNEDTLPVVNTSNYIEQIFGKSGNFADEFYEKNYKQCDLLSKIIACEVAMFIFRRTSGKDFCASVIDDMAQVKWALIQKYEKKYGKYICPNQDFIY